MPEGQRDAWKILPGGENPALFVQKVYRFIATEVLPARRVEPEVRTWHLESIATLHTLCNGKAHCSSGWAH